MSKTIQDILKRLEEIDIEIRRLNKKIDNLETTTDIETNLPIPIEDLLKLPENLRKTMITMTKLKEATAKTVAEETGRTRGMESIYLNQLVRMGNLEKVKRGRRIQFRTPRAK